MQQSVKDLVCEALWNRSRPNVTSTNGSKYVKLKLGHRLLWVAFSLNCGVWCSEFYSCIALAMPLKLNGCFKLYPVIICRLEKLKAILLVHSMFCNNFNKLVLILRTISQPMSLFWLMVAIYNRQYLVLKY